MPPTPLRLSLHHLARARQRALRPFALFAFVALPSAPVAAHAPAEVTQFVSTTPADVIIATNRGLVLGDLNSRSWSLLCNEALGPLGVSTSSSYHLVALPSGRWLLASVDGLTFSDDRGCSWQDLPALPGLSTPALVQHPSDPTQLYIATYDGKNEGAVRVSRDGGESFETLLQVPGSQFTSSLLVAPTDPVTLYIATIGQDANRKLQLQVASSTDGGAHWEWSVVPRMDTENGLRLLAVNLARPQELLARASASEPALGERLLWSRDGGKTFTSPMTLNALKTAAFSHDGTVAYAGGVDGLWRASDEARTFAQVPLTARIAFVEEREGTLLAGGYYNGLDAMRDGVGVWTDGADPVLQRWMHLNEVSRQADCPAPSAAQTKCASMWQDWLIENPPAQSVPEAGVPIVDPSRDAGTRDATNQEAGDGRDAGTSAEGMPPASESSDGCTLRPNARGNALGLLAALALFLRRRRSRAG